MSVNELQKKGVKSNFRQIEIETRLNELETRVCDLRLTILAAECVGQLMNPAHVQETKNQLFNLENEQAELRKQLRKLQLNQARQRKYREKKKKKEKGIHELDESLSDSSIGDNSKASSESQGKSFAPAKPVDIPQTPVHFSQYPLTIRAASEQNFLKFLAFGLAHINQEGRGQFLDVVIRMRSNFLRERMS
jgi:hypothetical protein